MGLFNWFKKKQPLKQDPLAKERRLLPRWEISCSAQVKWEGQSEFIECEIRDLNFRGCRIVLAKPLGETCSKLTIRFSEDYIFDAEICILWQTVVGEKRIYGARFTRLRDQDKEKIYQFVFAHFPDQIEKHIRGI